ncbi:hypothetical protein D3C80_1681700 [compost metagenome]
MPGKVSGRMISRNAVNFVAPSIIAASSRSFGIPSKKDCIRKVAKGTLKAVYTTIKPVRLLVRPSGVRILKIGATSMTSGNICVSSISATIQYLARKLKRESA